jgi:hypothetical protein
MHKFILVAACLVSISGVASAAITPGGDYGRQVTHFNEPHFNKSRFDAPRYTNTLDVVKAPEIDAASAAGALTLLLGGVAVLRGRRRHQAPGAKI